MIVADFYLKFYSIGFSLATIMVIVMLILLRKGDSIYRLGGWIGWCGMAVCYAGFIGDLSADPTAPLMIAMAAVTLGLAGALLLSKSKYERADIALRKATAS